ncbi:hypothetical protein [Vibrio owensii]|uniref:hypothetical protein n=1 Tax=Vibrio owensii TaxID=696485 RepID=UPI0018F2459F|nr:hypothetical protein [Vibrio owensii]
MIFIFGAPSFLPVMGCSQHQTEVSTITFQLPENIEEYRQKAALSSQEGYDFSIDDVEMIEHQLSVNYTEKYQAVIEATVRPLTHHKGSEKVVYFQIINHTAYVVLTMDEDAWSGISATLAAVRPMVKKNLLQFDAIKAVRFQYP